jgi:Tol biopolymer transport system component
MPGVLPADANLVTPPPPARNPVTPPPTAAPAHQPISRFGIPGVFIVLTLAAFAFWGYPRFINSIQTTPQPATVTSAPPTFTSTSLPAATATQMPTEAVTPTVPVSLGIGGADKVALTANDDIYIMDIDGSNINQLTNTNIPKFDLQWLPGGAEILYGERNCVYKINVDSVRAESEEVACFNEGKFEGFRVSPDGMQMAISIERRLLVLPFDLQMLSSVTSAFELQGSEDLCLDYADVAVKGARWSADGQALAIVYQSVVNQRIGDTIRVIEANMQRCQAVDPLIMDEFPAKRFVPEGYERYPVLPFYNWDGNQQFLFNSLKRNVGYGELYLYDISTTMVAKINPVDGVCCYGTAAFSPDGTHILLVFQDERRGADSESELYYIPVDQINSGVEFVPIRLPLQFFPDLRESIQLAMRPATP